MYILSGLGEFCHVNLGESMKLQSCEFALTFYDYCFAEDNEKFGLT